MNRFRQTQWTSLSPLEIPAELLLVATTVAAIMGLDRVFEDRSFFWPLLLTAVVAHFSLIALRRLGVGLFFASLLSGIAVTLQLTWSNYSETSSFFLPGRSTIDAVDADLETAWGSFGELVAPVPVLTGYLIVAGAAIWLIAVLADWAAFRLGSAPEAVLPASTLVIFVAIFGVSEGRLQWTLLYAVVALAFVLAHRAAFEAVNGRWLRPDDARRGYRTLLVSGAVAALAALFIGSLAGPALPGVDEAALLDWEALDNDGGGGGSRVVLSPLVAIQGRLVSQSDVEVFSVNSDVPTYWRLTSLDSFDGATWTSKADYNAADGGLPSAVQSGTHTVDSAQQFEIAALAAVWLPAAFEPRTFSTDTDVGVGYEPGSSTLIVSSDFDDSDGLTYEVESALPRFDKDTLAALPAGAPPEIEERYLQLPDDFSPAARAKAVEVTADAQGPYEQAYDLQWWFLDNFDYSLDVDRGHSSNRFDDFLASGVGYCEQFAGYYAAMARSIGLPTRVAVGFTPGEQDPNDPTLFLVRGEHAHAWPEVYIEGAGWVPFEPTPGRGAPGAVNYTDVPVQQDTSGPSTTPTSIQETPQTTIPQGVDPDVDPQDAGDDGLAAAAGDQEAAGSSSRIPLALLVVLGIAGLVAAYMFVLPRLKQRRRRPHGTVELDPSRERVEQIWDETVDTLAAAGVESAASETPNEFARRAAAEADVDRDSMRTLGAVTTTSRYAEESPTQSEIRTAESAAEAVQSEVQSGLTWWQRKRHQLDPRPLVGATTRDSGRGGNDRASSRQDSRSTP